MIQTTASKHKATLGLGVSLSVGYVGFPPNAGQDDTSKDWNGASGQQLGQITADMTGQPTDTPEGVSGGQQCSEPTVQVIRRERQVRDSAQS